MEGLATARRADEVPAGRAIATTVPRADIRNALADPDEIPELLLDLTWRSDESEEHASIGLEFSREDLELLLAQPGDDGVVLTFDGEELAHAFDDVEAHGLRERAVVFAIAAAGAIGSSAAIANAARAPLTYDGPQAASAAPALVSDAASGGGYSAPAGAADRVVTDASSGGGYQALSGTDAMVTDASSGGGYAPAAGTGSAADAMRTDVSSAGGYGTGVGATGELSGPMLHVGGPSTTDELLIGGAILAIAGAAFAARRQTGSARPA